MTVAIADTTVRAFHALSDPTRFRIVEFLRDGERCVCELMDLLDAAQSRLSFHLKVLKDAGLLSDRREGRWVYYRLRREGFAELGAWLGELERETAAAGRGQTCC